MNNINYVINLQLKDNNVSAKVKNLQVNFSSLDNSVNKVSQTVNAVSADISNNITEVNTSIKGVSSVVAQTTNNINKQLSTITFGAMLDIVRNVSDGLKTLAGAEIGIGFEQSMADLSSITGIVGSELNDLGEVARQTGKDSGLGAAGAADAFALLASQIQVDKIGMEGLKTLQKETITLAQAGGMSMADSATAMAATINQFGLEATEANRVINVLAAGSKYGAAEINDLAQSFKVTGAVASAAGLSVEQTAGAIEVLSKNNLKGAEAGTALRNILVKMQTTLGIDVGETGLSTALEALKPKLNDVTFLAKTFGAENLAAAQFLITNAAAVDEMTTAVTGTNVAQEQAAIRTNTTAEQMKRMQATIDDLKIGFFNISGGMTAYIAAMGDSAVMVAQMIPLFSAVKSGLMLIATANGQATIATIAKSAAEKAGAIATGVLTAAQAALNAVMNANPIALIVTAIAALIAGLIAAYTYCDGFRRVVDAAWEGVKNFVAAIWNSLVKAFEKVSAVLAPLWSKLKALLGIEEETTLATEKTATATEALGSANLNASGSVDLLTGLLDNQNKKLNTNLSTIGGVEQKISDLKTAQKSAMDEQAIALEKEIRLWEKKQEAMKSAIIIGAATPPELKPLEAPANKGIDLKKAKVTNPKVNEVGKLAVVDSSPLKKMAEDIDQAHSKILSFNESIWGTDSSIGQWADNTTASVTRITTVFQEFGTMLKDQTLTTIQQVSGGLQAMGALMGAMGGLADGAAGSWLSWGANILAMVAAALPQLLALFGVQSALAVSEQAKLPFPLNLIAIGATVAGIAAAVMAIPKPKAFANGGIVYGNTFAQVGEYPGAANNPEVIAPLSKLRSLLEPASGGFGGTVEFVIKGNRLVGVLNKESNKGKYF